MGKPADRFSSRFRILNVGDSGLEVESDHPDREHAGRRAVLATRHPFDRNERFADEPPRVIRWMWNPFTGDALMCASGRHADILRRFRAMARRRSAPFGEWLRGFWFPRTKELVMRPYDVDAIGWDDDWTYSDRMQRRVKELIEKQLKRKIPAKRFFMNVTNEWLSAQYGGRW